MDCDTRGTVQRAVDAVGPTVCGVESSGRVNFFRGGSVDRGEIFFCSAGGVLEVGCATDRGFCSFCSAKCGFLKALRETAPTKAVLMEEASMKEELAEAVLVLKRGQLAKKIHPSTSFFVRLSINLCIVHCCIFFPKFLSFC